MSNQQPVRNGYRFSRAGWFCLIFSGVVATVASYLLFDGPVSGWFLEHPNNWHHNPWVDGFRQLGKAYVPLWLLAVWSCLTDRWRPTVVTIVAMILVGSSVVPLKAIVQRPRPRDAPLVAAEESSAEQSVPWQKRVSFPSGDTAVAFAAAATLSLCWGRLWTPVLFAAAGVIGLLRITALAHYPSDVAAGTLIGVLCGMGAMEWVVRRWPRDELRVAGRWRLFIFLVLVLAIPFASPFIGMRSLQIFLGVYAIPLFGLTLICLAAARLRGRARRANAARRIERESPRASISSGGRQSPS